MLGGMTSKAVRDKIVSAAPKLTAYADELFYRLCKESEGDRGPVNAKPIAYEYMGARIEFVRDSVWVARRDGDILHSVKGWMFEYDELNEPEDHDQALFEFGDVPAAELCISSNA